MAILTAELQLVMRNENETLNQEPSQDWSDLIVITSAVRETYPFKPGKGSSSVTRKYARGFYRRCETFRDCSFTVDSVIRKHGGRQVQDDAAFHVPFGMSETVYLACDEGNQRCLCREHWGLAYTWNQRDWSLSWDSGDPSCTISMGGPCGAANGLWLKCPPTLNCVSGRCREKREVGRGQVNDECDDDLDCSLDLACLYPRSHRPFGTKRCFRFPSHE